MTKLGIVIIALVVAVLLVPAPATCQNTMGSESARTFDGHVVSVEPGASLLTVKGGITMTFPITIETVITKNNQNIRLYEIKPGDYVAIGYYKGEAGPAKTMTVSVKYSKR